MTSASDQYAHILAFRAAMEKESLVFKGEIEPDAGIQRIHIEGDAKGSRNGWYLYYSDGRANGVFGTWKGAKYKWKAEAGTTPMTLAERTALRAKITADKLKRAAEQQEKHDAAAARALEIWEAASPAPDTHPYLHRKGIASHGARIATWTVESPPDQYGEIYTATVENALIVPIKERKQIVSLQAIFPSAVNVLRRGKDFLAGGKKKGCYFPIGELTEFADVQTVVICEGFATGASIHQATGLHILVAFDAGNLESVASMARRLLPDARMVIAADNDQWTAGPIPNPGRHHAQKAADAVSGMVAMPEFKSVITKPTDFNDLAVIEGEPAVMAQITAAIRSPASAAAGANYMQEAA